MAASTPACHCAFCRRLWNPPGQHPMRALALLGATPLGHDGAELLLILRAPEAFVKLAALILPAKRCCNSLISDTGVSHRSAPLHYVSREDKASAILYDQYPVTKLDRIRHFASVNQLGVGLKETEYFSAWGIFWFSSTRRAARSIMYSLAPRNTAARSPALRKR